MITAPARDPNFALHNVHGELAQHRFWRAVRPHVRQFRMAVDAGAHIGLWTRLLAREFKFVTAFEPVPENFACLQMNVLKKSVRLENVALGSGAGACGLTLPAAANSGCWRVDDTKTDLEMRTLDSYGLRDVDFIKIDVEGYEGEVLEGARQTISKHKPTIVFEENGLGPRHFGSDWVDPARILAGLQYRRVGCYQKNEIWAPR